MSPSRDRLLAASRELEPTMSCEEGKAFVRLLASAFLSKHEGASEDGRRTAYYTERKALQTISLELAGCAAPADVTTTVFAAALAKAASNNRSVLKSAFEIADSALESGFCSEEGFFAWFRKRRALLAESGVRSKTIASALLDGMHERMIVCRVEPSAKKPSESRVRTIVTDAGNGGCFSMLDEFVASGAPVTPLGSVTFLERFAESIGFSPESFGDLSVQTFDSQLRFFSALDSDSESRAAISQLKRFYAFAVSKLPEDQRSFTFETGLPKEAITYRYLADRWLEGYRAVMFNPLDPPPAFTKWLLFPNEEETRHSSLVAGKPQAVDVGTHEDFQNLLVAWLWSRGESSQALRFAGQYCNELISEVAKRGRDGGGAWRVTPKDAAAALLTYRTRGRKQIRHIKGHLRSFLEFGENAGLLAVETSCWLLLETTRDERGDGRSNVEPLSLEETGALARELERRAGASLADEFAYIVFCTQALTPLRQTEILTMRVGDIVEGAYKGHHAVERTTKADRRGTRRIQIPKSIHRLLESAEEATRELRATCEAGIGEYLFLVPGQLGVISPLCDNTYRDKIADAGRACGVEGCNPSRLRKRYMTEMVEQGLRHNLSRFAVNRLTNHAAEDIVNKHYLREDIRLYLEATHGILIGNPRIPGEIVGDDEATGFGEEDEVERGCGYCRNETCNVAGTVTCLMCSGFLTSPQFIPQIEESIAILQAQIANSQSDHERQHLVAVKKLMLGYLGKLLEIKEGQNGSR